MKRKNRKEKAIEYEGKYGNIPINYDERLEFMFDMYKLSDAKQREIVEKKTAMQLALKYNDLFIRLLEEPEGTPRPRFRLVNRSNLASSALNNGAFVHVYSINAHDDHLFMKRMVNGELLELNNLIYTPCIIQFNAYFKTPSSFNTVDTFLAEIGLIRPLTKPDWDNVGKKYSDMFNSNVWLDDASVISGTVNKYYSILPRVEISVRYLNMLYNKYQYNSVNKKIENEAIYFKGGKKK